MGQVRYPTWRKKLANFHDRLFPEKSEQAFIRAVGPWWLRLHGFEHQGLVGPYRPDFISRRRRQIIEVEGRSKYQKTDKWGGYDILKSQEYQRYQNNKWNYYQRRGWHLLLVPASDCFRQPEEVKKLVRGWSRNPVKWSKHTSQSQ